MPDTVPARVRFGVFELDLRSGELRQGQQKTFLQEQPLQILRILIEREPEIVTREEIKKRLWPNDTIVEFDHSINAALAKLRRALGDSAEQPKYIKTVARRGYRFMVPVEWTVANGDPGGGDAPPVEEAAQAGPKPALLSGRTVSHYRVLDIIGGGGMGVVYRAEDLRLGRRVALKFLPEELGSDPHALERFSREARAASSLDHPNICAIYEFGEHEGQPFIVMQLLEGRTLRDWLGARESSLPPDELLEIGIQVSDGLEAAHEKGIIHRDIKPGNIFITDNGICKVLDFGLAKLLEMDEEIELKAELAAPVIGLPAASGASHLTRTGVAMGTAGYMSPEQVRGEKVDARTDLFSFGLVLYEMATGQRAFNGETAAVVHDAIINKSPLPIRELNPDISPELETLINKTLDKDREQRYQTAAQLEDELRRLKSEAHLGRAVGRESAGARRKHHWELWLAVSLLILLAGIIVPWLLWRRSGSQPEVMERQLTAVPLEDRITGAAISPDGKYVAYHDQTGLYVLSTDTGETHPVALPAKLSSQIFYLCWLPEAGKLLADVDSSDGADIWLITVLGKVESRLLYRHGEEPAISPDGRNVAFVSFEFGRLEQEVWVGGIDGEAPRKLVEKQELQNVAAPAWSPDGRWIAYRRRWKTARGDWSSAIEVRPANGGAAKTLLAESSLPQLNTQMSNQSFTQNWSKDWRLIFPVVEVPGAQAAQVKYSLWSVPVEPGTAEAAGKCERLTQWSEFWPSNLTVTADGKRLSFVKARTWEDVNLSELERDAATIKAPRRLTWDERGSSATAWTPDSKAIFFTSQRNGRRQIFRQDMHESVAQLIVAAPNDVGGGFTSPDGAWFFYWEYGSAGAAGGPPPDSVWLMRRATAGGSPDKMLELPRAALDNFWCASNPMAGTPCVLGLIEGKELVLYSFDPVRGKGNQLGKIEVVGRYMGWFGSPDGSSVAVVDQDKYGGHIEVLTLSNGAWREISLSSVDRMGGRWKGLFRLLEGIGLLQPIACHACRQGEVLVTE